MMKLSAIKKNDGSIWLVNGDAALVMEAGDVHLQVPDASLLPSMKYRDCWCEKDGAISVDLTKAKAQKLAEIRAERDARLAETDREWMILASQGQDLTALNAKKQALRDLPEDAEAALAVKRSINTIDAYSPEWP